MKLKVLFITFNIVLFTLLFTIFFLPLFYGVESFAREFWKINWFFGPIFLITILIVNFIFFTNKKIINSVENEDWTALSMHLETEVFTKKRITTKNVRLLLEALFLLGDFSSINRLEKFLKNTKPKYIDKFATKFAASKILTGNFDELLQFSSQFNNAKKNTNKWLLFFYAFSLQMLKEYNRSAEEFEAIVKESKNPLIKLLSGYFAFNVLTNYIPNQDKNSEKDITKLKTEIMAKYDKQSWSKYINNQKQEIHIMILTKVIDDATEWIFNKNEN